MIKFDILLYVILNNIEGCWRISCILVTSRLDIAVGVWSIYNQHIICEMLFHLFSIIMLFVKSCSVIFYNKFIYENLFRF